MEGALIILSSPSGAGKTTLVKKLSHQNKFEISVSYTTRIPRMNELNGKDYYFVSKNDFKDLIKKNELLEYAKVFDNLYGSSKKKVFKFLESGKNVLFDIDWQGTELIKKNNLKCKLITFFILPPSKKTLLNRLAERENNKEDIINERMKKFEEDVKHWVDYDYVVINDNLEICVQEIKKVINTKLANKKIDFNHDKIKDHVNSLII